VVAHDNQGARCVRSWHERHEPPFIGDIQRVQPQHFAGPLHLVLNGDRPLVDRPDAPVLVINGDILTTLDFGAMYQFHCSRGASATIASYPREVQIDFGVLEFGEDPHVLAGYREKPAFSFQVSMGVYLLSPSAWDFLRPGEPLTMPELLESMRGAGHPVHCFKQPCYWLDIGRHDDYATANDIFVARRAEFLGSPDRPRIKVDGEHAPKGPHAPPRTMPQPAAPAPNRVTPEEAELP